MSKRPATTSLTTPQAKKSRQAITLEPKNLGAGSTAVWKWCFKCGTSVWTVGKLSTFWKSYTFKDAITNITHAWKSVPETSLNGVWHHLRHEVVHDFKGFDEGTDVKAIMKLVKEVIGDSGFQEIQEEDVTELLVSMEDPLTSEEVLEMVKKHEEEEESTDKPQTVGKELTIPKLRDFMQNVTSATQSALQHDPDMERSMQVVEALNLAASTYSSARSTDYGSAIEENHLILSVHYPHQVSL
ncbi:Tigger transposable element-derived protein 1-like 109 [Homarus americanus]|uniref:Tigger transposable element-derived protein 1-like 109 n=1 Tax=Homarus americanus TaxID=6706 RepID=A0A8J5MRN6_HOMAM|nr:Tigger transposable element-derived protein 1-like 109 [Homarus americanus]